MTGQKFAIATVAGAVTSFIAGYLIYGLALMNYMNANTMAGVMKDPPDFLPLILAQIVYGALMTIVIGKWAKSGGLAAGAKVGAELGLLVALGMDLTMMATSNLMTNIQVVAVDVVAATVLAGLTGAVVGAVIGGSK